MLRNSPNMPQDLLNFGVLHIVYPLTCAIPSNFCYWMHVRNIEIVAIHQIESSYS
jgi:hypothetical protein